MTDAEPQPNPPQPSLRRVILAGVAGNVMEWYDFAVYGYFAAVIGRHFFPTSSPSTSLIAAFGAFAAGFLMRPLGGAVFGFIGDKYGRRSALLLSVLAMALPTMLIGLLPTYGLIGPAAGVALVVLRMMQGLAVGGEYTASIVYLIEHAPRSRRGWIGSWAPFGATAGILMGSAVGSVLASALTPADLESWGWRAAFLLGVPLAVVGLAVRRHLPEPPTAPHPPGEPSDTGSPLVTALRTEWRGIIRCVTSSAFLAVGFYLVFVYSVTWLELNVHLPAAVAFDLNTGGMVVLLCAILLGGCLADRVGEHSVRLYSAALGGLLAWPLLRLMATGEPGLTFLGQSGFAVLVGLFAGATPLAMAAAFPPGVRCSAVSVAYNLSMGALGGVTPLVATYLIRWTHDDLSPAFFLIATAVVSVVAIAGKKPSEC